jgi:DNA-binding CsgD family transcriptional regulator
VPVERVRSEAAQSALDLWAHAAIVLDAAGRVVLMNRTAEILLQRTDGLRLGSDGQLRAVDEARTRALDTAIRQCAAMAFAGNAAARPAQIDSIALPRDIGPAPLRAMLSPLPFPADATGSDGERGTVLLLIIDSADWQRMPVTWLARQFGLTPAEERLTEAIVNGVTLAEAAGQLGIRLSTARSRLKIIQAKTGCRRQVDLVRLALSLPQVRQG